MASPAIPTSGSTFTAEDGTVSTVLPESFDPSYEPAEDELQEYAQFIGIDVGNEPQLMWIAKEGLRTPLPGDWRACQTNEEDVYYFNFTTGESLWDHPLDDTFKGKVIEERAKLQQAGRSGRRGGDSMATSTTSSNPNNNTNNHSSDPLAKPLALSAASRAGGSGSTKAISDLLFAKPAAAAGGGKGLPLPPPLTRPGLPQPVPTRLGAPPDVSDILGLNASSCLSNAPNSSSMTAGLGDSAFSCGLPTRAPPFSSLTTSPPIPFAGAKDIEANMRRRIEEGYAPQKRQLAIDLDKRQMEEKKAMEASVKKLKSELDVAWEVEQPAKSAAQRMRDLQRELKEIDESWQKRLKQVGDQVTQTTKELEEKRKELAAIRTDSVEDLKKKLAVEREQIVSERRRTLQSAADDEYARVGKEQTAAIAELQRRETAATTTARKKVAGDNAKKLQFQETQSDKMLASLEEEVKQKRAELAERESRQSTTTVGVTAGGSGSGNGSMNGSSSGTPTASPTTELMADMKKRIAKAEAEADEAVEQIASACAADFTKLQADWKARHDQLQKELDAAKKHPQQPAAPFITTSTNVSITENSELTAVEEERLAKEEERLKRDLEMAARTFNQQTDALVLRQQRQCSGAATNSVSAAASTHFSGGGGGGGNSSLPRSASQSCWGSPAQSTLATSFTPLAAKLQQLEARHEERMRQLREENKKAYKAKELPYPRESESYAKLFIETQKAWTAKNPAPSADSILPKLDPVPQLVPSMSDMAEVPPPTAEDVRVATAAKLKYLREAHSKKEEAQLAALDAKKREELQAEATRYREKRLAEVHATVEQRVAELKAERVAAAEAAARSANATTTTAPTGPTEARKAAYQQELTKTLAEVKSIETELAQLKAAAAREETRHSENIVSIELQIDATQASIQAIKSTAAQETASHAAALSKLSAAATAATAHTEEARACTPTGNVPTPSKVAAPQTIVIEQPDYANYISLEEAGAEEAAMHAKWRGIFEELRRDMREAVAQEAALMNENHDQQQQPYPLATMSNLRPPTVPVSLSSCATPLQVRASSNEGAAAAAAGDDEKGGVYHTPLSTIAPYSVNASTIRPSPVVLRVGQHTDPAGASLPYPMSSAMGGVGAQFASPYFPFTDNARGSPFHQPSLTAPTLAAVEGGAALQSYAPTQMVGQSRNALPTTATDRSTDGSRAYAQRLARLHDVLRGRRRELRVRQQQLEMLRDEWRQDMRVCRERSDRSGAATLKQVKTRLEAEAHTLNREVVSLKEASDRLRMEESRPRDASGSRASPLLGGVGGGAGIPTAGPLDWTTSAIGNVNGNGNGADGSVLLQTLLRVAERTERLETLLLERTLADQRDASRAEEAQQRNKMDGHPVDRSESPPINRTHLQHPHQHQHQQQQQVGEVQQRHEQKVSQQTVAAIAKAHAGGEANIDIWLRDQGK